MKYKVGDKVRIVSEWGPGCCQNNEGRMDKWLGKVMTVHKVCDEYYAMKEDQKERPDGWCWYEEAIEGYANKFKVGDIVVGNDKADSWYAITVKGWIGVVTKIYDGDKIVVEDKLDGRMYNVNSAAFDIYCGGNKIVITREGSKTVAKLYDGKTHLKTANATCSPDDVFDFAVGAKLAVDRLIYDKETVQFYSGKVICVDPGVNTSLYTKGKIYRFKDGILTGDNGYAYPDKPVKSFDEWAKWTSSEFIEVVE